MKIEAQFLRAWVLEWDGILTPASGRELAELPALAVRGRLGSREEHQARHVALVAVQAVALAVEEGEPVALRVLHRAPALSGVQRDAGALGLGEHQPRACGQSPGASGWRPP